MRLLAASLNTIAFAFRFSSSDSLLNKILRDKSKKQKEALKREREEAKRKLAGIDSDVEDERAEDAMVAKFEESRAEQKRKFQESAGPPLFLQCLFPVEVKTQHGLDK